VGSVPTCVTLEYLVEHVFHVSLGQLLGFLLLLKGLVGAKPVIGEIGRGYEQ
jgi:hypothetical protein